MFLSTKTIGGAFEKEGSRHLVGCSGTREKKPLQQSPTQGTRSSSRLGKRKKGNNFLCLVPCQNHPNSTQNASLLAVTLGSENRGMGKLTESQTFIITDAAFVLQELTAADHPSPIKLLSVTCDPRRPVCPHDHRKTCHQLSPTLTTNAHCSVTELSSLSSPPSPNVKSYAHFIRHYLLFSTTLMMIVCN